MTMPVAEGGGGGSKGPNWLMIGGAAAGIIGLILLISKSGGSGTTAAGTSINAALGSIQEQNMNLLGQQSADTQNILGALQGLSNTVISGDSTLMSELDGVNQNVLTGNQQSLETLQDVFKRYAQDVFGYQSNLGGNAGFLALPSSWQDFQYFLENPSLASPAYQAFLEQTRGYVFYDAGQGDATFLGTNPHLPTVATTTPLPS